jgi:hypothetical protein
VSTTCCQQLLDCNNDSSSNCFACVTGQQMGANCMGSPTAGLIMALNACIMSQCATPCAPPPPPPSTCNPVTNDGCDVDAGEACDLSNKGSYTCFPAPNTAMLCGMCTNAMGPFCEGTMHCLEDMSGGKCARYCCDDGDCAGGKCDMSQLKDGVGVCVLMLDAGVDPSCNAPMMVPSNGSCFTIPSDGGDGG